MKPSRDLEQSQGGVRYELTKESPAVSPDSQDVPLWLNILEAVNQLFLFCQKLKCLGILSMCTLMISGPF